MDTACGGMRKRMGDAAAIADDIQPIIAAHQLFIDGNLHIIELYLYTIKEGIIICCAGRNLIECINHFDNAIQQAFWQNKTQITGGCIQCRCNEGFLYTLWCGTSSTNQIAEALHNYTTAQHIAQAGNGFAIAVGILEWFRKMLGNQQSEVCIACLQGRVLLAMPVYSDKAVCVFIYNSTLGVHAEGTHLIPVFLGAVYDFTVVKLIGKMRKNLRW